MPCPSRLADLEAGEAVLVEFGRRQALGVVLAEAVGRPAAGLQASRSSSGSAPTGRSCPPLSLGLARWISGHYLAPAAVVLRAMLPPRMLERLELVAEIRPATSPVELLGPAGPGPARPAPDGPRAVRDLAAPEGRAGLLRRLRDLAGKGVIDLDWTLTAAAAGPRYERWVDRDGGGPAAGLTLASGGRTEGRPLGPRQLAAPGRAGRRADRASGDRSWPAATARRRWPASSGAAWSSSRSASVPADRWPAGPPAGAASRPAGLVADRSAGRGRRPGPARRSRRAIRRRSCSTG